VSITTAEALVRRWQHDFEKGLSLRHMRPNFGVDSGVLQRMDAAAKLVASRTVPLLRSDDSLALTAVVSALRAYVAKHAERGKRVRQEVVSVLTRWNSTLSARALELAGAPWLDNPAGGVRRLRREQVLASSGFIRSNGSAIDLAPFFSSRHSIRQFDTSQPVEFGLIAEAVRRAQEAAPSVCNRQGGRVYMLTSEAGKRAALQNQNGNGGWGHEADVVLVLAASQEHYVLMREERYQAWVDGGMWSQAILMGLHSVGLAACPLNWNVPPAVDMQMRRDTGIPGADTILMLVAVGHYPEAFDVAASPRKPLADVLYHESLFRPASAAATSPARRGVDDREAGDRKRPFGPHIRPSVHSNGSISSSARVSFRRRGGGDIPGSTRRQRPASPRRL
jgi:nitroreductase